MIKNVDSEWKTLSRNDWTDILELSQKKTFQRKFQIVEAFVRLVAEAGFHRVTHAEIAKRCRVTRQLVDHHFDKQNSIVLLSYRYIYARFQKRGSDALVAQNDTLDQLRAYLKATALWVNDYRADARFLVQFFAIAPLEPDLIDIHERNILIGQERLHVLLMQLKKQGHFKNLTSTLLMDRASSVQMQIAGYVVLVSAKTQSSKDQKESVTELVRSCFAVLGLQSRQGADEEGLTSLE